MIPALVARQIREQIKHYLTATFHFRDLADRDALERFIEDDRRGIFKGPWLQLHRPFVRVDPDAQIPLTICPKFTPYRHQWQAWQRLNTQDKEFPQPTLITTGTGSGKTECFLYPVLDHCYRHRHQRGIKALVLYPMNALASDQERRFAKEIHADPRLHGIRVGLFTGRSDGSKGTSSMGPAHGISDQEVLRDNPPDILLTNYKMLDYLLMRPSDRGLWQHNEPDLSTSNPLKYIILDELHTYDGAQGADVACLLRRVKERLGIKRGAIGVVGTSATIDDAQARYESDDTGGRIDLAGAANSKLLHFASAIFEEDFIEQSVIGESREEVGKIVDKKNELGQDVPSFQVPAPDTCEPLPEETAIQYATRQAGAWGVPEGEEPLGVRLTAWLRTHPIFRVMLELFEKENVLPLTTLVERLAEHFIDIQQPGGIQAAFSTHLLAPINDQRRREAIVHSFLALVANAEREGRPFVSMRSQVWLRELRRLGRAVSAHPRFTWLDERDTTERPLPAFNCTECGTSGWVGMKAVENDNKIAKSGVEGHTLDADPGNIYKAFFARGEQTSRDIVIMAPYQDREGFDPELPDRIWHLHPISLVLRRGPGACPLTGELESVKLIISEADTSGNDDAEPKPRCPYCGEKNIMFIGAQGATLASVAIDEMFGTPLNNEAKLLAFTDSVQDASHRAGFFTARTYNFTLRTALCATVHDRPDGRLPLQESATAMLEFWKNSERLTTNGDTKDVIATLLPPDLREYEPYLEYRDKTPSGAKPGPLLRGEFEERLLWEVCSQFSLLLTRGRTLEFCGAVVLGWREEIIERVLDDLLVGVEGIDSTLTLRTRQQFHRWLLGVLYRGRARGALGHRYLDEYASKGYWGKRPFGRFIDGRDVYPPAHPTQKPKLLGLGMQRSSDQLIRKDTSRPTWYQQWTRRALEFKGSNNSVNDLLVKLLTPGTQHGLFQCKFSEGTEKKLYVLNPEAALLYNSGVKLVCTKSKSAIVRPENEASILVGGPSYDYYARTGILEIADFDERELYYQNRYRKNIPRRVVAAEHTGLLATETREQLEKDFGKGEHRDDPNVITCTSTLEMGIDIGDLSSTMLCSIPPTTSNYLQRIGRAGRKTGSALIVSIVNQRPHDLFFYGRPLELLRGSVSAPGCWLDAAAVLARQYFGFCLDSATSKRIYREFPKSASALLEDLNGGTGVMKALFDWLANEEEELQERFLGRFGSTLRENTRLRFKDEVTAERLQAKLQRALTEFSGMLTMIKNSLQRLDTSAKALEQSDENARQEINREQRQLKGRQQSLNRVLSYELLCDHGLLPNYAFPERGVPFYGFVYRNNARNEDPKTVELVRGASTALRELAPGNFFYTDHKKFEIQRLYIGREQESLLEKWYFCSNCSFIASEEQAHELHACPQCHRDGFNARGRDHVALEFSRSQASSYMEYYDAYAGDSKEEREVRYYNVAMSFDTTTNQDAAVVGCTSVTFGIEYRPFIAAREFNTGYSHQVAEFEFDGRKINGVGFKVCADCGATEGPWEAMKLTDHARSCTGRKNAMKEEQAGRDPLTKLKMVQPYLYRDLRSEGIRLLIPFSEDRDIETLKACVTLGLRLRFEGNPNHLLVRSQTIADPKSGLKRHYLVLMDAVPGGTGFLKSLFEGGDREELPGTGILDILGRARRALEECECTRLPDDDLANDTDGCYQCLRTYNQQYKSDLVSRAHGVRILDRLLQTRNELRVLQSLAEVSENSLLESQLEERFISALEQLEIARLDRTVINGKQGYRLKIGELLWEIEVQPRIGKKDYVSVECKPDFIIRSTLETILPIAVFLDGYKYHVETNRLRDDVQKRRALWGSKRYLVWSLTWDDITAGMHGAGTFPETVVKFASNSLAKYYPPLDIPMAMNGGLGGLIAFLKGPFPLKWRDFVDALLEAVICMFGKVLSGKDTHPLEEWGRGNDLMSSATADDDSFACTQKLSETSNLIGMKRGEEPPLVLLRIDDRSSAVTDGAYKETWQANLHAMNLFQFNERFDVFAVSEVLSGGYTISLRSTEPEKPKLSEQWQAIADQAVRSLTELILELHHLKAPEPTVEYFADELPEEAAAELAWPERKVAILVGDQWHLHDQWEKRGWRVQNGKNLTEAPSLQEAALKFYLEYLQ